jgi:hypothetical protein
MADILNELKQPQERPPMFDVWFRGNSLDRRSLAAAAGGQSPFHSRRNFLRVGAVGGLGMSLQAGSARGEGGTHPAARAKSVILVFLGGGMSHHDSFDLKLEAAPEIRGKYGPIDTSVSGTQIGELLPRMAQNMDKVALVRSGAHNNDHHETATNWVLCGRFGTPFGDYPAMGAVVSHELGFDGVLPPYVSIPRNPSFTWELGKSAFLGGRYESFKTGDPNANGFSVRDLSKGNQAERQAARRQTFLSSIDRLASDVKGNDQLATYDEFRLRANDMIHSPKSQEAFAIEKEPDALRDKYGRNTFGQSCLLARRMVESGVRFTTINYGGWDHHGKIFEGLDKKLPEFDAGFATLLEDMTERGLMKDTLVVCMGEFGRTPIINKDAGRDHWGPAASLLFAGAGVQGGKLIGATDKQGAYVTTRPYAPADVSWTIYEAIGVDPRRDLVTPDGRPISILDSGENMAELYA